MLERMLKNLPHRSEAVNFLDSALLPPPHMQRQTISVGPFYTIHSGPLHEQILSIKLWSLQSFIPIKWQTVYMPP